MAHMHHRFAHETTWFIAFLALLVTLLLTSPAHGAQELLLLT